MKNVKCQKVIIIMFLKFIKKESRLRLYQKEEEKILIFLIYLLNRDSNFSVILIFILSLSHSLSSSFRFSCICVGTDETWVSKLYAQLTIGPIFQKPKFGSRNTFIIQHFADKVVYQADGINHL